MSMPKEEVINSILMAQAELTKALLELKDIPGLERQTIDFATHALSNFLTVTDGTCELLLKALEDYPDPQIRIWLEGLQQATGLMSRIVIGLAQREKVDFQGLKFEKVNLPLLAQRVCNYYTQRLESANIRLSFESLTEYPFVRADRVAVAAVMDNLLSNAVKYSPPGTQITVTINEEAEGLVCAVQDQGPGLSRVDQARLFQKGHRLSTEPQEGKISQGSGLLVAKALVDLLQGEIWCESELSKGASFKFRLPLWEGEG
jgi:signal transduction histidine kinase